MKCVLADIADVTMGQSPKSEYYNSEKNGMPFLQGNKTFGKKYPTFDTYTTYITKKAKSGDVIMSVRAPVGDVNITPIDMCLGRGVCGIRMKNGNQEFLFYLLKYYMPRLVNKQSGTVFGSVNKNDINNLEIDIPEDFTIQRKIARYLSMLDEKIELNEKINKNLQLQAQTLFTAWFETFEPFDGVVPDSWQQITLGDIAEIKTNSFNPQKNPDALIEHYSIPAFDENKYPVFEYGSGIKSNKYILSNNSVMISKLNPDTKRVWRPLCLSDLAVSSTEFIIFEPYNPKYKDYVYSVIDSQGFTDWMCSHTTGSTNSRQRTTPATTLNYNLWMPDDESIEKFLNAVTPMYDLISQNLCQNQELVSLRDSLLPKLMSGELDVSEIDI